MSVHRCVSVLRYVGVSVYRRGNVDVLECVDVSVQVGECVGVFVWE
jgi:hypothetical protein